MPKCTKPSSDDTIGHCFNLELGAARLEPVGFRPEIRAAAMKSRLSFGISRILSLLHPQISAASRCRSFWKWLNRKSRHTEDEDTTPPTGRLPEYHLNKCLEHFLLPSTATQDGQCFHICVHVCSKVHFSIYPPKTVLTCSLFSCLCYMII